MCSQLTRPSMKLAEDSEMTGVICLLSSGLHKPIKVGSIGSWMTNGEQPRQWAYEGKQPCRIAGHDAHPQQHPGAHMPTLMRLTPSTTRGTSSSTMHSSTSTSFTAASKIKQCEQFVRQACAELSCNLHQLGSNRPPPLHELRAHPCSAGRCRRRPP